MEIQKIYSDAYDEERIYSVLMTEDELKMFTKWDNTDQIKGMKDADILAERGRSNASMNGRVVGAGMLGAGVGAGIGGALGKFGKGALKVGGKRGAGIGAAVGAGLGAVGTYMAQGKKREENSFYNNRLKYAKHQALRRESKDWGSNNRNREGYTY